MRKSSLNLFYAISLILLLIPDIYSQQEPEGINIPGDTVFTEIFLDKNGVNAYDRTGNPWYYDFQNEVFIMGEDDFQADESRFEGEDDETVLPVEERCTEPLRTKPFGEKSYTVGYDEYVDDDIVVTGRVNVKGWVKGNITSINGRVTVSRTGRVDGDIEAPEIVVREGGVVLGSEIISENSLDIEDIGLDLSVSGIIVILSLSAFFIVMSFIINALMVRQQERVNACIENNKIRTGLFGFIVMLLLPVFLAITIVGIVLIPFIPFLYLLAFSMGIIYLGDKIGGFVSLRIFNSKKSSLLNSFIGLIILMMLWMLTALLLSFDQQPLSGFGIFFLVISIIIMAFPICSGVGAAVLTRFGFKEYTSWKEMRLAESRDTKPAPPPIPKSPDNQMNNMSDSYPLTSSDLKKNTKQGPKPPPPHSPSPPDNL